MVEHIKLGSGGEEDKITGSNGPFPLGVHSLHEMYLVRDALVTSINRQKKGN